LCGGGCGGGGGGGCSGVGGCSGDELRHCATSRKVAGSIPDVVIGIFHLHNPSGRTMALGSTQPLTEMSTRNIVMIYLLTAIG